MRAEGRTPLTPAQARTALRETGSPQQPAADGSLQRIGSRPDIGELIEWAMEATPPARPTTPRPRRRSMRVTITIDDDGDGPSFRWGDETSVPYIRGPYIRGPYLYIPRDDGPDAKVELATALQHAEPAEEEKG